MKKTAALCFVSFVLGMFYIHASSVDAANRKTAVRCLKLSENYLQVKDYENALSQAELGISYDESVADLWYIKAASLSNLGESKAHVLPLVTRAMTTGEWVDYNRSGARILYADLLSDTGNYDQALAVLDAKDYLMSSDADFIRVKSLYKINTPESVQKAREKVDSARKVYSSDTRFPHVFFKYEYMLSDPFVSGEISYDLRKKIADSFIAKMPEYQKPDAELEVYACIFAEGENQKRLLQAFSSHAQKHPLYAAAALKTGLMNQQEAWDYFCDFADKSVSLDSLEEIIQLITDEDTKESVKEHLNAYNGELLIDSDRNGETDVWVKYQRGRPLTVQGDLNNDGIEDWHYECDFGVPETVLLSQGYLEIHYGTYPSIVKVVYKGSGSGEENGTDENLTDEEEIEDSAVFYLPDEAYSWSGIDILPDQNIKELFDFDFYVPFVNERLVSFEDSALLDYCSSYELPSKERRNSWIRFSVLDGKAQSADYYEKDRLYAHCVFEGGMPLKRSVDNDGDCIFEVVEWFGYDKDNERHTSILDQSQLMTNLFGLPYYGSGLYVRMIQIDQNLDTEPDFTEEYLEDGGKITAWDLDYDGSWDVRYKKYPRKSEEDPDVCDSDFYLLPEHRLVTVTTWNDEPVKIQDGEEILPVTQGNQRGFYWVGEKGDEDDEFFVLSNFDAEKGQGVSEILDNEKKRMLTVKIGENIYARIIVQ